MQTVSILLCCLACLSLGRRVQNSVATLTSAKHWSIVTPDKVESAAAAIVQSQVLFAAMPAAGFKPVADARGTPSTHGLYPHVAPTRSIAVLGNATDCRQTVVNALATQADRTVSAAAQKRTSQGSTLSSLPIFITAFLSLLIGWNRLKHNRSKDALVSSQPLRRQCALQMSASPDVDPNKAKSTAADSLAANKNELLSIPTGAPPATGTLLGAISLIAGTTVGAGILALPAKTFDAGFGPSAVTLFLCWIYMSASGILIAEVNINTLCALEKSAVSFDSMVEETLGELGARVSGAAYVFIHYALLIAYILQGGSLLLEYLQPLLGAGTVLPTIAGPLLFTPIVGGAILLSSEQQIETGNSILFAGVVASFLALVSLGLPNVDAALLARSDVVAVVPAIPICVLALVYHNVVPTVCFQLGCDAGKIRTAITVGAGIPALMFILWNFVILGSVPPEMAEAANAAGTVFDPLVGLRASGDSFGSVVRAFSLLAIVTSFIGFAIGLQEYFADAFSGVLGLDQTPTIAKDSDDSTQTLDVSSAPRFTLAQRSVILAMTLVPPLGLALYDPSLFFTALDNAGTFGILVLFGILPAAMAWQQRYGLMEGDYELPVPPLVPGGRFTLALMAGGAAAIIAFEIYERVAGIAAA